MEKLVSEFQEKQDNEILNKLTISEIADETMKIISKLKNNIHYPEDKVFTIEHLQNIQKEVKKLTGRELMILEIFINASILVYLPDYLVAALYSILRYDMYKDTGLKPDQLMTAYFLDYVSSSKGKFLFGKIIYDATNTDLNKEMITLILISLIESSKKQKEQLN